MQNRTILIDGDNVSVRHIGIRLLSGLQISKVDFKLTFAFKKRIFSGKMPFESRDLSFIESRAEPR